MITLGETGDFGSAYSDIYKDCFGFRPRGIYFETIEEMKADYYHLALKVLPQVLEEKRTAQEAAIQEFDRAVLTVTETVLGATKEIAIKYLVDAEAISPEEFEFYGYESLEHAYGLPYGHIKTILENAVQ